MRGGQLSPSAFALTVVHLELINLRAFAATLLTDMRLKAECDIGKERIRSLAL